MTLWPWLKVFRARSRAGKVQNLCLVYIFFMDKHWFLLHTMIAYDLSVSCHWPKDIWARSKSLAGKMQNLCPVLIFWLVVLTLHNDCLWAGGVSWPWHNVICAKSMSLAGKVQKLCPIHIILMDKHLKFVHIKIAYDL